MKIKKSKADEVVIHFSSKERLDAAYWFNRDDKTLKFTTELRLTPKLAIKLLSKLGAYVAADKERAYVQQVKSQKCADITCGNHNQSPKRGRCCSGPWIHSSCKSEYKGEEVYSKCLAANQKPVIPLS